MADSPTRRMDRPLLAGVLLAALLTASYKAWLILSGAIDNLAGDASVRAFLANYCRTDVLRFLAHDMWHIHWPPGQFLLLAAVAKMADTLHIGVHHVTIYLLASVLSFGAAQVLVYVLGRETHSRRMGVLAFIIFSGIGLPNYLSLATLSEPFVLPFLLSALLYVVRFERGRSGILPGALLLLAASLFRTEVVFIAGLLFGRLLMRRSIRPAFILIAIAAGFTLVKVAIAAGGDSVQYLNASQHYSFASGLSALNDLRTRVAGEFMTTYAVPLWTFGLVYLGYLLYARKVGIYGFLLIGYSIIYLVLIVLGYLPAAFRYFFLHTVLFAFIVAAGLEHLLGLPYLRDRARLRRGAAVLLAVLLGAIGIHTIRKAGVIRAGETVRQDIQTRQWLNAHLDDDDRVFFDFINFRGIYFRSYLRHHDVARNSFDYTSFYTNLPPVARTESWEATAREAADEPDNTARTAGLMRATGYDYLGEYRPRYLVVAGETLFTKISRAKDRPIMVKPFLRVLDDESVTVLDIPGHPRLSRRYRLVFDNRMYQVYEAVDDDTRP